MNVHEIFRQHCEDVEARITAYNDLFNEMVKRHEEELMELKANYIKDITQAAEDIYGPEPAPRKPKKEDLDPKLVNIPPEAEPLIKQLYEMLVDKNG